MSSSMPGRTRGKPTTPPRGSCHSKTSWPAIQRRVVVERRGGSRPDGRQERVAPPDRLVADGLVHDRAGDDDLLLGGQQGLPECRVPGHQPAQPDARQAVRLGQARDADDPLRARRRERWQRCRPGARDTSRRRAGTRARMRLHDVDDGGQGRLVDHLPGGVVGRGQAHQPRLRVAAVAAIRSGSTRHRPPRSGPGC